MRKYLLFVFLYFFASGVYAQAETAMQKKISGRFEEYFNNSKYDSIYNLFGADMQKALPLQKTVDFLSGIKSQAGKITKREYHSFKPPYVSYKTQFERNLFDLQFAIGNEGKIDGFYIRPFVAINLPVLEKNTTPMILPFKDEWTVIWGGDTKEQNYHVEYRAQKNAFDIVITDDKGKSFRTDGKINEDYYAFGKELIAPCDGEVVLVVDGVKDNIPGELNPTYVPGNTVIIKTAKNEYLFFAHFKQHSIKVKQGQVVKQGELLGLCGNSGNSSEAHLHFHIQNIENMVNATGAKCYFGKIVVNGEVKNNYSPVKGERIRN